MVAENVDVRSASGVERVCDLSVVLPCLDEAETLATCQRMSQLPGVPLSKDGDKWVIDGSNVLVKAASSAGAAEVYNLMACTAAPPDFIMFTIYQFLKSLSILWARANPVQQTATAG